MGKKKKNWDLIRNQKDTETVKYRDVYEDQQLERTSIAKRQTMTGRVIFCIFLTSIIVILTWFIISAVQMYTNKAGLDDDANPKDDYVYVKSHYYNVDSPTNDILTNEEYDDWYKIYHDYDDKRAANKNEKAPDAPVNDMDEFINKFAYNEDTKKYSYTDDKGVSKEVSADEYKKLVKQHEEQYNNIKAKYDLYYKQHTNPEYIKDKQGSGKYSKFKEGYVTFDYSNWLSKSDYENAIKSYEDNVKNNTVSKDIASIPLKPINYPELYVGDKYVCKTNQEIWDEQKLDTSLANSISKAKFEKFLQYCSDNGISISTNPYPNDIAAPKNGESASEEYIRFQNFYKYLRKDLFAGYTRNSYYEYWCLLKDYCDAVHYDRTNGVYLRATDVVYTPTCYRSKLDGSVISIDEYKEYCNKYTNEKKEYDAAYLAHRQKYHPDDINGTATVFTMQPNSSKVLISLVIALAAFSLMFTLMKKNLKAQNLLSDTSDINQYHNDQHIALPEEVQKNYDWFPDVGAHSGVQVSSMISHMAITNKGLKNVTLAKRADKDILDADGDVEYYKGEILLDSNGKPITANVPIIDTDFMEALFDASSAPKDKNVRHYYDTTKIPYNPDGSNRDKLGKYATVADLINDDWEFPLYEPQRPAGAYIVDTAPVNTMV